MDNSLPSSVLPSYETSMKPEAVLAMSSQHLVPVTASVPRMEGTSGNQPIQVQQVAVPAQMQPIRVEHLVKRVMILVCLLGAVSLIDLISLTYNRALTLCMGCSRIPS